MERREPPATEEGWYVLHDLRVVDWDAWRRAPERQRRRAVEEGVDYLRAHEELEDAEAGGSATFSVLGHDADLLVIHMRPTTADLDLAERRFERTALADFTERAASYVSVTEVSGYTTDALRNGDIEDIKDAGLRKYLQTRLYPSIPDAAHLCFYPMDKRRGPGDRDNWYDLPFEERADLMASHGEIGREYGGRVTQIITGSIGFDDYEWGVTLFADDPTNIKHLLYEMRFDPSTSRYAEFGPFYFGRRFPPEELGAFLAGEPVPTGADSDRTAEAASVPIIEGGDARADGPSAASPDDERARNTAGADEGAETTAEADKKTSDQAASLPGDVSKDDDGDGTGAAGGRPDPDPSHEEVEEAAIERRLRGLGINPDEYPAAGYGLVFRSTADAGELVKEVEGLRGNFEHYDTHVLTTVRAEAGKSAVVSLWANQRAATVASGFLADLSGVNPGVGGPLETDVDQPAESATTDGEASPGDGDEPADASGDSPTDGVESIRTELADLGVYAGQPHGEDVYAVVLYSEADPDALADELSTLRERFEDDDTHTRTAIYEPDEDGPVAVVSLWETPDAAEKAGGFLADLPGVVGRPEDREGFETMGMFYTVEPDRREEFRERFAEVGDLLANIEGHRETNLLVNRDDENDMFIASRWASQEDAIKFFRSDAFRETVQWGREVLADRPRHVFLT